MHLYVLVSLLQFSFKFFMTILYHEIFSEVDGVCLCQSITFLIDVVSPGQGG